MKPTSIFKAAALLLLITVSINSQWFQQVSGTTVNLHSINSHHGNENLAWSCGDSGVILHTTNGGINWVQQVSGTTNNLLSICFMETAGGPVMAVGEDGIILRTTNNGTNWITIPSPTTQTLRDISDYNFVAVGDNGTILKSSNDGLNWVQLPSPVSGQLNAVSAIFSNYIVGNNGILLKGFSSGTNWVPAPSGTSANLNAVPLFGSSDITVGAGGLVWRSSNFGANWFSQNSNTGSTLRSVEYSVNNTSRIYICGAGGTIIKSTNNGDIFGFQAAPVISDLNSIFFYLTDERGYCCGNNGVILKTNNGGGAIVTEITENSQNIPQNFTLEQNYPNPFNPVTKIRFSVPLNGVQVTLEIFDASGKTVAALVNGILNKGKYEADFDAGSLASGVYFSRLTAGNVFLSNKMVLAK
jgi:photosystem II stability/assembly factor-like uncharacterized protein